MSNIKNETIGFWKNGERIVSNVIFKTRIPKWCRLMLVKNRYKKAADGKPDYVAYFIDCKEQPNEIERPYQTLKKIEEYEEELLEPLDLYDTMRELVRTFGSDSVQEAFYEITS